MGLRVHGLDELHRNLTAARVDLADQREPLQQAAEQAAGIAAGLAPRRTGRLAASVTGRASRNRAVVTAAAPYASVVNYGSRNIPASRFMQRADPQAGERVLSALRRHVDRLIGHRGLS